MSDDPRWRAVSDFFLVQIGAEQGTCFSIRRALRLSRSSLPDPKVSLTESVNGSDLERFSVLTSQILAVPPGLEPGTG